MMMKFSWLNQCRALLYDVYWPPFWPKLEFDADKAVNSARRLNANTFRAGCIGKYAYYRTEQWVRHPELGNRDILSELIPAAHTAGMRVIVYIPFGHALPLNLLKEHHPEWLYRPDPDSESLDSGQHFGGNPVAPPCLNSPYAEALSNIIHEVVEGYDLDGIYFDGLRQGWHRPWHGIPYICYCPFCQKRHKDLFGEPLPRPVKGREPTPQEVQDIKRAEAWNFRMAGDLFLPLVEWIRSKRQMPVIFNRGDPEAEWDNRILDNADGFLYEAGEDFLHRIQGIGMGVAKRQMVWQYVGGADHWPRLSTYKQELFLEAMATRMSGGANIVPMGARYLWDERDTGILKKAFTYQEKLDNVAPELEPVKFCAILHSGQSVPVSADEGEHRYLCLRGAFAAFQFGRVQCTTIPEEVLLNKDLLNGYKVLFLPNVAALSDTACAAIREFVSEGGGLIATYATSLFDENGNRRSDLGLKDVLGVSYQENKKHQDIVAEHMWRKEPYDTYLLITQGSRLHLVSQTHLLPAAGYLFVTPTRSVQKVADIVIGTNWTPLTAGIIMRRFGKGRVAYIASELEYVYWQKRCPEIRSLFAGLVRWTAGESLPYEIKAPEGVFANLNAQPGTLVLHLLNNCKANHEIPRANYESVYPVRRLRIRINIPENWQVQSVTCLTDGNSVKFRRTARGLTITLPVLTEYEAVVVKRLY